MKIILKLLKPKNIIFGCTGTIGEKFPVEKITSKIPDLIKNIKYTQNKLIWMKAALGIMTTDTQPKMAMEECLYWKDFSQDLWNCKRLRNDTSKYGNYLRVYFYRCRSIKRDIKKIT